MFRILSIPVLLPLLLISLYSRAQCPQGLAPGTTNIVTNGDFSSGNTDFSSEYTYCNTANCMTPEATYTVAVDPSFFHIGWEGADHTTGNGNFLIANGAATAGKKVWCQTVTFEPSSHYIISVWVTSVFPQSSASLQLYIAGFPFFSAMTAPGNINTWSEYTNTFQSGILETVEVCLVNTNVNTNGNDFGIDDISIKKCECALTINAGPDTAMCYGDSVQLDGSGAIAYVWSPQAGLTCSFCEDPVASPASTTTYYVSLNGPGGCVAIDSAVVTVFPHLDLHTVPDTTICPGKSVLLHADGAESYSWHPSSSLSDPGIADPLAFPTGKTTYYVDAVDAHGCNQSDSTTIDVYTTTGQVSTNPDTIICFGKDVFLLAEGGHTYEWQPSQFLTCFDCADPVASPLSTITYVVTATDSNGCSAGTDSVKIEVDLGCSHLNIPTAFSPNGDGKNDSFHVLSKGVISFDLKVYNRWGQLVFSSINPDTLWNGQMEGKDQPVGVYVWTLRAQLDDGTKIDRNGNVTLVR